MNPFYKNLALWMVIGLIVILLFQLFQQNQSPRGEIVFSDFLKKVETGEVREVTLKGNNVSGRLSDGSTFRTYTADYPDLVKSLKDRGVKIDVKPAETNSWLAVVLQWVPMLLFIGVWAGTSWVVPLRIQAVILLAMIPALIISQGSAMLRMIRDAYRHRGWMVRQG